ncbi:MAG: 50S ribosomal protein L10 [Candidatus Marsarchaeota archaeon]|nr:50S ribosomal protein L10 [Candidatus Marsarchaeota archaeon]
MINKKQKMKFVEEHSKLFGKYKSVGIIQLNGIPDRLFQLSKNKLRADTYIIVGRKNMLKRVLESNSKAGKLVEYLGNTSAIVFSNKDPFELNMHFKSNALKLAAKPNQIAPQDITISSGETSLQPGKSVTELKQAGIDTQIQKGKVVIAKDKTIKKGEIITTGLSKALQTLNIKPFNVSVSPSAIFFENMIFSSNVLSITRDSTIHELNVAVQHVLAVSMAGNIVNALTINKLIAKAYNNAMCLGVECKIYDSGIVDKLLAIGSLQAKALENAKK